MNANELTWQQRGALDRVIGVPFSASPAPDLFERDEWEKGWLLAEANQRKLLVRIAAEAGNRVLAAMRKK